MKNHQGDSMKKTILSITLFIQVAWVFTPKQVIAQWNYPPTKKTPVTDIYFGKAVNDNYRWLESINNADVKDWLKAQHDFTDGILDKIPGRNSLINDFIRFDTMRPASFSSIIRKNGRYFFKKTLPGENVGKLYYREGVNGKEILLFDPTAGISGKSVSLTFFLPTEDGKKVVLGIAEGGSMTATMRIMEVDNKTMFPESISPCWFGIGGWTKDGKGFVYNLLRSGDVHAINRELNTRTFYHAAGTDPKSDQEIFSAAKYPSLGIKPRDFPLVNFSDDFQYIFGFLSTVQSEITVYYAPASELLNATIAWKPLLKPEDEVTDFSVEGNIIYLMSHKNAPKLKILSTDLRSPDVVNAKEVLAQGRNILKGLSRCKDYLFAMTSDGINNFLHQYSYQNKTWEDVNLPLKGTIFAGGYDITTNDCNAFITSWNTPTVRYDFNPVTSTFTKNAFNFDVNYPGVSDIVVEEVETPSHDGVMVPLSIIYNKNIQRNGNAICFLDGYGAYGNLITPSFSTMKLALINRNVVVAVAHVRGGGEKGHEWYQSGYKTTKPNTWKDFIACAEYLVKNKYTSSPKIFGMGTSAGGILIGRAITERPDLFGAAICNVGCANALRMENSPNGPVNALEFGTVKDSVECMALMEMDAFQHVKEGVKYPAVICVGGINDPSVIIWQPGKFAAALQNASTSGKPVLMQVNYDNGHFTEDKKVTFRNFANMFAFCLWQTGHADFQMKK
jgi:prolyl oligopeptidase